MKELPKFKDKGKWYYIDAKLCQIREVNNPYNFEDVSKEFALLLSNILTKKGVQSQ